MRTPALTLLILTAALGAQSVPAPRILEAAKARGHEVMEARRAFMSAGHNTKDFHPDLAAPLREVETRLAAEKDPADRQALLVTRYYYLTLCHQHPEPAFLRQLLGEVPALSPDWSLEPGLLASLMEEEDPACQAYTAVAMAGHPDPEVRRNLLFDHFWERLDAKDEAGWRSDYQRLLKEFPESEQTKKAKEILGGELKTMPGRPAPAFSIQALDQPGVTYTLDTFKGSYLLLDFWATWCPPCRAEMPHLHKAWARFKGKDFHILSLSFDRRIEHIAPFRKQAATPMPWSHAYVQGGFTSALAQAYGVKGIPKPLLIGPDGTILATGADVRGENLEKTLEKYLK
nr:TlpA disulfide reductase family protein [uncultured Holophaga sp.]